jgi:hypothetical protein
MKSGQYVGSQSLGVSGYTHQSVLQLLARADTLARLARNGSMLLTPDTSVLPVIESSDVFFSLQQLAQQQGMGVGVRHRVVDEGGRGGVELYSIN